MTGINYITNEKGENTGLLIDFGKLKQSGINNIDIDDLVAELEDILAIELSKEEEFVDWVDVKQDLKNIGKLD